ncbi:sensor domain-containing protein [Kocuria sp. cx-116]|uniref:sensor histidine kinase n=1 Tax=Kocuria sp. cx-116 TaxID=2771378 RepID=UPI0016830EBC|nr:histidine kinase [Kocuria sp. cx-116]MBD2763263.1 sensor domain-containing protein [Kocuria sp. cx-116]
MSTPDLRQTPPWESTEAIPADTEHTRPLPPHGTPQPPQSMRPSRGSTATQDSSPEWSAFSPKTMFFGTLDLVIDALLNFFWVVAIGTLIVTGIAMIPAVGVGLLVLAGTVYVIWAAVWLERRRSASSFGLDLRDPQRRRTPRTDWVRVPHQLWLDATDGSMWLGFLHLILTCILGVLSTISLVIIGAGIVGALSPLFAPADSIAQRFLVPVPGWPEWSGVLASILTALIGLVLLVLLTLAHRGLSATLLRLSEAAALRREADESRRQVEYATEARESAVRGAHTERSRIERDLHDGVQPQLVSVAMNLSMAKSRIDTDPAAAKELITEAHGTTKAAITELRRLARGFHPAVLEDRGLDAAISAVAAQASFPVTVNVTVPRLKPETEAAVYFAVSESLTNAVKHSGARTADVAVSIQDGDIPGTSTVVAGIRDYGRGGARVVPGGGLSGIEDRIRSAGGRFFLNSPTGGPTEVIVQLPLGEPASRETTLPDGNRGASGVVDNQGA